MEVEGWNEGFEAERGRVLAGIRVERNQALPIGRIPRKVLGKIFIHVTTNDDLYIELRTMLEIAHVCHEWRETVLETPDVWSRVELAKLSGGDADLVRHIVARSKDNPLYIRARYSGPEWDTAMLEVLFEGAHRLRVFTALLQAGVDKPANAPSSAPELEELHLVPSPENPPTPVIFDDIALPKLSKLTILRFSLTWRNPLFRYPLTRFKWGGRALATREQGLLDMLQALGEMPLLEELCLIESVLPPPAIPEALSEEPWPTVRLPHLRYCYLDATCDECTQFLRHVIYPSTARIDVQIDYGYTLANLTTLCEEIATGIADSESLALSSNKQPVIRRLLVAGRQALSLLAWTGRYELDHIVDGWLSKWYLDQPLDNLGGLSFRIHAVYAPVDCPADSTIDVATFLQPLPVSDVQTLVLANGTTFVDKWWDLAKYMPNVKELSIISRHSLETKIAPALSPIQSGTGHTRWLWPRLKVLMLLHVVFRKDPDDLSDNSVLRGYRRMLAARKRAGHMVKELWISEAVNFREKDAQKMERFVGTVTFDINSTSWASYPECRDTSPPETVWESESEAESSTSTSE